MIDHNVHVMLLTETWLQDDEQTTFKELTPLGYKLVTVARPQAKRKAGKQNSSKGGGLTVIHKEEYTVRESRGGKQYKSFELLDVKIETPFRPVRVVALYRPPDYVSAEVLEDFLSLFDDLIEVTGPLVIAGDFNVHVDSMDSPGAKAFLQLLAEYGLTQHVNSATHTKGYIIDLFITKNHTGLSPKRNIKGIVHVAPSFASDLADRTADGPGVDCADDVTRCCEDYFSVVRATLDQHAPLTTKARVQVRHGAWMNSQIKAARVLRRSCETRWRQSGLEVYRQIFVQQSDEVHKLILAANNSYYERKISRGGNREAFAVLSELTKLNGVVLPAAPSQELANRFASFFTEKIQAIQQTITTMSEGLPDLPDYTAEWP